MSNELVKLRELFAAEAHKAWSGWMDYLFDKSHLSHSGETTIPRWATERWKRQAATPYSELPEQEKQSDREEADRYLQHIPDRDIKALEDELFAFRQALDSGAKQMQDYAGHLNDIVFDFEKRIVEQVKTIAALTEAVNGGVEKVTEQAKTIARPQNKLRDVLGTIDGLYMESEPGDSEWNCAIDQCVATVKAALEDE